MGNRRYSRRDFLKTAGALTTVTALGGIPSILLASGEGPKLVRYPEKTSLSLLTSRPPNLETPLGFFKDAITPNEALFVRWHLMPIPTSVDLAQWRLRIGGNTEKELLLSMEDLKKFEKVTYTAVIQCAGNGRAFFEPRIPGAQWKHGSMGNVTWSGVRVKDLLNAAGMKPGSIDVAFDGLDRGMLPSVPDYIKSLPVDKAMEEDILVAYEMNHAPLTMLNGFPARLVVPGWYATYWVKSLSAVTVHDKPFEEFWMKTAYRIPDSPCACVPPGGKPRKTAPIGRMNTRSLIIDPAEGSVLKAHRPVRIMGIAFSGGYSIRDIIVSTDGGGTWGQAELGRDYGKYSWIQWFYSWKPAKPGRYTLMAKATDSIGQSQPRETLWNPAGYQLNRIEPVTVAVS